MCSTGNETFAHPVCYERDRLPVPAHSLYDVIMNTEDRVLAANIIANLTPHAVADGIVRTFNRKMMEKWRKRVEAVEVRD